MRVVARLFLITFLSVFFVGATEAQITLPNTGGDTSEIALPDPLTPEAVREMVSLLSDAQVRSLLLARLDAVAQTSATGSGDNSGSFLEFVANASTGAVRSVSGAFVAAPLLWTSQAQSFSNFHERLGWQGIGTLFGSLLLAMAVGFAVELVVNRVTHRQYAAALDQEHPDTLRDTLRFLSFRLIHDVLGLGAFFVVTRLVAVWLMPDGLESFAQVIMLNLVVMPRIGAAFIRFLLAPENPQFRIVHTDDASAKFIYRHQIGVFILMGFSIAAVNFNDLNGVSMGASRLGFWLNLAVHLYLMTIIWKVWDGLVPMMRGADPDVSRAEEWAARYYPVYAIGVVVGTWILVNILVGFGQFKLLQSAPHYKMMFILTLIPAFDTLVRGLVRHLTPPMTGEGVVAERAYHAAKHSYIRVGRVVIFGFLVLTVAKIWGLDLANMAAAGVGVQFAGRLIEIMMILAIGYLVWEVVSLWINSKLATEQTALGIDPEDDEPGGGEGGGAGGSRLSTVLPLVLGISKTAIAMIFGLIALGNIGIDITPLLAGAGIVGLAVGFGAQRLVADIVSGIFFLVDDAFRTGEYVEIEGTVGSVEKISIRSMQLRHHRGLVHTIPYGEIPKITNYSRDWVIMKLKFTVPFDTDPNKIKKLFKKIGAEMMEVPAYAEDLMQPFKSQGVFDFDDVGMIIRGNFMAKPGKQFTLRKEIYNRVKAEFEAAGIEFARREVRVAIPGLEGSEKLSEEEKAAVSAAASDVARQQVEDQAAAELVKKSGK